MSILIRLGRASKETKDLASQACYPENGSFDQRIGFVPNCPPVAPICYFEESGNPGVKVSGCGL